MENDLLFCSKLMFTNGNIVDGKYIICFYSNLYFCQTHIWTSLLFIYLYQVLHIWKTIFTDFNLSNSLYFKSMIAKSKDMNKIVS
jgi:hypothetical protein